MKVIFKEICIENFKGINKYSESFNKDFTEIIGDNGKGKTTILDFIYWIFYDKDSLGRKKFDIYPFDANKVIIPGLDPTGTLVMECDGTEVTLKKVKTAKATEYYYDGIPVLANVYTSKINEIIDEKLFYALISPVYFGDNYTWQEQKALIMDNFKVEDTAIQEKKYVKVKNDITTYGIDATLAKYEKLLKDCSNGIIGDQSTKSYIEQNIGNNGDDSSDKATLMERQTILETKLSTFNESKMKIADTEIKIKTIQNEIQNEKSTYANELSMKRSNLNNEINRLKTDKSNLLIKYKESSSKLKGIKDKCQYCEAPLDTKKVNSQKQIIEKEMQEFVEKGTELAEKIKIKEADIANLVDEFKENKTTNTKLEKLKKQLESLNSLFDNESFSSMQDEIKTLKSKIDGFESVLKLKNDLIVIEQKINKESAVKEEYEMSIANIKDYSKKHSELVAKSLNKLLKNVVISTFNIQKNGDIKETFEITMGGVPYSSLNTGGKVEAGVELIQLISNVLDINFPVIIDNKESITKVFKVPNQMIILRVVENCTQLTKKA